MASYHARPRDPLLDSSMQAAIERRGKELVGIALIGIGIFVSLMLASYVPEDPSWMSATDAPAQNIFGRLGASLASPLFIIVGAGSWAVAIIFLVWGLRFIIHRGEERIFSRIIFAPIVIALASVYASTHVPGEAWTHSFGLGGLFGDTVLGALLNIAPGGVATGLRFLALIFAVALLLMGMFILGFDREEIGLLGQFMLFGVVMIYIGVLKLLGSAGGNAYRAVSAAAARRSETAETGFDPVDPSYPAAPAEPYPAYDEGPVTEEYHDQPDLDPRPGLFSRIPTLVRRADPQPELVQPHLLGTEAVEAPAEDRIKAKIANAVRNRSHRASVGQREEPPLMSERKPVTGPKPLIATRGYQHEAQVTDDHAEPSENMFLDADDGTSEAPPADQLRSILRRTVQQEPASEQPRKVVQQPLRRPARPSRRAQAEAQPRLQFEDKRPSYEHPPLSLLTSPGTVERQPLANEALEENARMLENVLDDYGVKGEIVSVRPGPVVTMYELEPAPGLKASRVIGLADDIARSMSALSARVSTVPGRSVIGIELPNNFREKVVLREILSHSDFGDRNFRLPLALGKEYRWRSGCGQPCQDAASPDCRDHGLGQIGCDQHYDPEPSLQAQPRGMPPDHDRSQDAGT